MQSKTVTTKTFSPEDLQEIIIAHIRNMYRDGAVVVEFKVSMETQQGDYHAAYPPVPVFKGAIVKIDRGD